MTDPTDMRPRFDAADWAACDEHERTYLIGEPCPECVAAALAEQLGTTPADLLAHAAESVRAPTETTSCYCARNGLDPDLCERVCESPNLTTERATELAARWAEAHGRGCSRPAAEREQLFAWVAASERYTIPGGYKSLAADLGISEDEAAALCQDVWPS